jgi:hypothetical protein
MGGASGVIKSILPYLNGDKIYLMGVTYNKSELYKEKNLVRKSVPIQLFIFQKDLEFQTGSGHFGILEILIQFFCGWVLHRCMYILRNGLFHQTRVHRFIPHAWCSQCFIESQKQVSEEYFIPKVVGTRSKKKSADSR